MTLAARPHISLLCATTLALCCGCSKGANNPSSSPSGEIVCKLTLEKAPLLTVMPPQLSMSSTAFIQQGYKDVRDVQLPKGVIPVASILTMGLPGMKPESAAFLAKTSKSGTTSMLCIDWNGNRKIEENEVAPLISEPNAPVRAFRPPTLPPAYKNCGLIFYLESNVISPWPENRYVGDLDLGNGPQRIELYDTSLDGRISGPESFNSDLLVSDFNGDGRLTLRGSTDVYGDLESEAVALAPVMHLSNGLYYIVTPDPAAGTLTLRPDPTPTGTVRVNFPVEGLATVSQGKNFEYVPLVDGKWTLHAGSYNLERAAYRTKSADGTVWLLNVMGNGVNLDVSAGRDVELSSTGPFQAGLQSQANNGNVAIYFWVQNQEGSSIFPIKRADGGSTPSPSLTIRDAKGKVLEKTIIRIAAPIYPVMWAPPKGVSGKFSATVHWENPLVGTVDKTIGFRL